ncbi:hypothetical protein HDV00_012546 [Rhizophlyctis rosea]|nr:hypothetical protein HDV00_012546 [Rhizophlyctis rosea]
MPSSLLLHPALTSFPPEILSHVVALTAHPRELSQSCKLLHTIASSRDVRAHWLINTYGRNVVLLKALGLLAHPIANPFAKATVEEKDALMCSLIRLGADITYQTAGVFLASARAGLASFFKLLYSYTKNIPDPDRLAILETALMHNQVSILDFLFSRSECDISDGSQQVAAVRYGAVDALVYLVNADSFIHPAAFGHAVKNDEGMMVRELIRVGRKLDSRVRHDENGDMGTPSIFSVSVLPTMDSTFLIATEWGSTKVVKTMMDMGVEPFVGDEFLLKLAAMKNRIAIAKLFMDEGASPDALSSVAFREAAARGFVDMCRLLIENGADAHAVNNSAIISAAQGGHTEVVEYLIEKGVGCANVPDNAAVMNAAVFGHSKTLRTLLDHGSSPQLSAPTTPSPLLSVLRKSPRPSTEIVEMLIEAGAVVCEECVACVDAVKESADGEWERLCRVVRGCGGRG